MKKPNHALIAIDVQAGFLTPYTSRALPKIHQLLTSNAFDIIIATRFYNPNNSPFRRFIGWNRLSNEQEIALEPMVANYADIIIDKSTYGAGIEIAQELDKRHINLVTLVGIDTDVCVLQNAAYLFDHGYEVYVDLNACATNGGAKAEQAAVYLMQRTIGYNHTLISSDHKH